MPILEVNKVYESNQNGGDFKVQTVRDLRGNDLSHLVDVNVAFHDNQELKKYLAQKLEVPITDMYVIGYA